MKHKGKRLQEILTAKGLSNETFCHMAGLSLAQLTDIFTNRNFNDEKVIAYCKMLEISVDDFLRPSDMHPRESATNSNQPMKENEGTVNVNVDVSVNLPGDKL